MTTSPILVRLKSALTHSRTDASEGRDANGARGPAAKPVWRRVIAPVVLGLVSATIVVGVSTHPGHLFPASVQGPWYFTFPVLGSKDLAHWQASAIYLVGLVLLGVAWAWLLRLVRADPRVPAWVVLAVFAVWSVPFLVGPPVSSDDVVSYAGVGRLVDRGLDPYEVGVEALGFDPVVAASSPFWRENPAPYGPLHLGVTRVAAAITPDSFRATIVLLRLFGFVCLGLLAFPLASLARRAGNTPAFAFAVVLCSPLVVVNLVGAAHNEALMVLLLASGVVLGLSGVPRSGDRRRPAAVVGGVVLCGLAAAVKLPALLGAVLLGWLWSGRDSSPLRRLVEAVGAGALAAGVLLAVSVVSGFGLGWISNLGVPQKSYTLLAPFTAIGVVVERALVALGWPSDWVLPAFRPAGLVIGIAIAGVFVWRADRLGGPMALGLALLALAWTTPAVWPWYMAWGLVFVGTAQMPVVGQAVVIALNLVLTPLGPGALDVNAHPTATAALMTLLFLAAAAAAFWTIVRRTGRTRRLTMPAAPPGADVVNA